jgi:hypothetical protein
MNKLVKHASGAVLEGSLIALLVVGLMAGTAFAGKGGSGGKPSRPGSTAGGTVSVVMVSDANANGSANYGDQITFTVTGAATTTPSVQLDCRQSGALVYSMSAGIYPAYPFTQVYTLRSNYWTGGAAACVATLYVASGGNNTILSTTSVAGGG